MWMKRHLEKGNNTCPTLFRCETCHRSPEWRVGIGGIVGNWWTHQLHKELKAKSNDWMALLSCGYVRDKFPEKGLKSWVWIGVGCVWRSSDCASPSVPAAPSLGLWELTLTTGCQREGQINMQGQQKVCAFVAFSCCLCMCACVGALICFEGGPPGLV